MKFCIFFRLLGIAFIFNALLSCNETGKPTENVPDDDLLSARSNLLLFPANQVITFGDSLRFEIQPTDSQFVLDSVEVLVDNQKVDFAMIQRSGKDRIPIRVNNQDLRIGSHTFLFRAKLKGKAWEQSSQTFFIASDKKPDQLGYQIVQTYPHDPGSFTQGLEWSGNQLFEGTGLNGKSFVMETDLKTGSIVRKTSLEQVFFGEGITILNNELYQITWKNKTGFVYSLPDLKQTRSFSYQTDGWGLTHWNGKLVVSDGTNKLYFLDPITLKSLGSVEVWDDKQAVQELNELETVGDVIYANKYTTDSLVKIDPQSGKVLAYINMTGLLKEADRSGEEDVLNGIAWKGDENLFYLTGKNWPKMFAVRFTGKQNL